MVCKAPLRYRILDGDRMRMAENAYSRGTKSQRWWFLFGSGRSKHAASHHAVSWHRHKARFVNWSGTVSADSPEWMAVSEGLAWPRTSGLSRVTIVCFHPVRNIGDDEDTGK